jgi:hypothetical protein
MKTKENTPEWHLAEAKRKGMKYSDYLTELIKKAQQKGEVKK